jgi:hypothetical protein
LHACRGGKMTTTHSEQDVLQQKAVPFCETMTSCFPDSMAAGSLLVRTRSQSYFRSFCIMLDVLHTEFLQHSRACTWGSTWHALDTTCVAGLWSDTCVAAGSAAQSPHLLLPLRRARLSFQAKQVSEHVVQQQMKTAVRLGRVQGGAVRPAGRGLPFPSPRATSTILHLQLNMLTASVILAWEGVALPSQRREGA